MLDTLISDFLLTKHVGAQLRGPVLCLLAEIASIARNRQSDKERVILQYTMTLSRVEYRH